MITASLRWSSFISGAIMMACLVAGLIFLRFWRQTRDRFFVYFAVGFWLMAVERCVLQWVDPTHELRSFVYLVRLAGFLFILTGIIQKNRRRPEN